MTQTLALILFLLPLAYSPGPGNMLFAANGARFGLRATVPASLGYHAATLAVTVALGLGAAGVMALDSPLATALRVAGSVYVLWLALGLWQAGALTAGAEPRPMGALGGAWLFLVNPKAYVIIALMFSQFLRDGSRAEVIHVATVFTLNNMLAFAVWAWAGDRLAQRLRAPRSARTLNRVLALLLAGVALWMMAG